MQQQAGVALHGTADIRQNNEPARSGFRLAVPPIQQLAAVAQVAAHEVAHVQAWASAGLETA